MKDILKAVCLIGGAVGGVLGVIGELFFQNSDTEAEVEALKKRVDILENKQ